MPSPPQFTLAWLLAYITFLSLIMGALIYGRSQALHVYSSAAAQAEWDTWREDAKKLAEGAGPVRRRAPKSDQPPALVLMRDHFAICLILAVVLSTVLFATFMILVRGAMKDGTRSVPATYDRP